MNRANASLSSRPDPGLILLTGAAGCIGGRPLKGSGSRATGCAAWCPLYPRIGRKLIESIVHSTLVHGHMAREVFSVRPIAQSVFNLGFADAALGQANGDFHVSEALSEQIEQAPGSPRRMFADAVSHKRA